MNMIKLRQTYKKIQKEIETRIEEFKNLWKNAKDEEVFAELCFCLCTPQTKAVNADKAIKSLLKKDVLFFAGADEISKHLKGLVRFHNNKANYIVEARNFFSENGKLCLKCKIDEKNTKKTRFYFYENIKGLGLKEASHFMRNLGFGENLAILDRHILKNLVLLGVLDSLPKNLDKKEYLRIEQQMQNFAEKEQIPLEHLDFIFWRNETGQIFK